MIDRHESAETPKGLARRLRLLGLAWLAALILLSAESSIANDLDTRIDEAERLSLSDPDVSLEQLDALNGMLDTASARQRNRIELIRIRLLGIQGRNPEGLERAIRLAEEADDLDQKTNAIRLGANLAMNSGRFETAFSLLSQAQELLPLIDSADNEIAVFGLASFFHSLSGDILLAVDYGTRAVERARSAGNERSECVALGWLGHAYFMQQDFNRVEPLIGRARDLCEQHQDHVALAWIENLAARVAIAKGQLNTARQALERSRSLNQASYRETRLENELVTARLHLLEGRYRDALTIFSELADELQDNLRIDRLVRALDGAAIAASRLNDMPLALDFLKRQGRARQAELERTRSLRMAQLSTEFDRDRSQQEIELLREQQRVRELDERARSQQLWIRRVASIAGLLVVSLLLIGLWRASRERRHYRKLSDQDSLTGLYNHTRFFRQLDQELAQGHEPPLVLVFADIDHFKQVNDRFGHQIGDEVLRHSARVIQEVFGDDQLIGRIGGEEFGIRLLRTEKSEALARIETLRNRLAGRARRRTDPPITLSFGLAVAQKGESLERLRQRTDAALYHAKAQGRNRVAVAGATTPEAG